MTHIGEMDSTSDDDMRSREVGIPHTVADGFAIETSAK